MVPYGTIWYHKVSIWYHMVLLWYRMAPYFPKSQYFPEKNVFHFFQNIFWSQKHIFLYRKLVFWCGGSGGRQPPRLKKPYAIGTFYQIQRRQCNAKQREAQGSLRVPGSRMTAVFHTKSPEPAGEDRLVPTNILDARLGDTLLPHVFFLLQKTIKKYLEILENLEKKEENCNIEIFGQMENFFCWKNMKNWKNGTLENHMVPYGSIWYHKVP